jgi:glucosamine-6-phosphate deaminase
MGSTFVIVGACHILRIHEVVHSSRLVPRIWRVKCGSMMSRHDPTHVVLNKLIIMRIDISPTPADLGKRAAADAAAGLRAAIQARGKANLIVATGASQFEMLAALVQAAGIDWTRVTGFHLDEYAGMPASHPASFRKYLQDRFVDQLPQRLAAFHYVNAEDDCAAECKRLGTLIEQHPVDVACIGIGENGHLAFNDPPADFATEEAYITVQLDNACRQQQFSEGWFATLDDVPKQAISMSIRQIMKSAMLICSVPDARKAAAVTAAVHGTLTPHCPASILRLHGNCTLYLDEPSASGLPWRI